MCKIFINKNSILRSSFEEVIDKVLEHIMLIMF